MRLNPKLLLLLLTMLIGHPTIAADLKEMRAVTSTTYDRLWKKAGSDVRWNDDWHYKSLRECLSDWEYKFLIAAMFDGVVSNGGLMHGMACFLDAEKGKDDRLAPDELIAAFKEIGSRNSACAIEAAVGALKQTKLSQFGEASGSDYELIDKAISKGYSTFKEDDLEILFYHYIQRNTKIEQTADGKTPKDSQPHH